MKVDSRRIRTEREKRAWSQEHLAEVAGLSLRTIQRIESAGSASYESVRALAAVLEIDIAALRPADEAAPLPPPQRFAWPRRSLLGAAAVAIAAAGGLFIAGTGFAEQIMLDVGISMNDKQNQVRQWNSRVLVDEGALVQDVNDVSLFDVFKLQFVPTVVAGGHIEIAAKVFMRNGADYELVTSPRIIVENGEEAEIRLTTDDGTSLTFMVTPQRGARL